MPFPYLGNTPHLYPQYRDVATGLPLRAEPDGAYMMVPVTGQERLPIPPQDGRWGPLSRAVPAKTSKSKAATAADEGAGQ